MNVLGGSGFELLSRRLTWTLGSLFWEVLFIYCDWKWSD